MCYFEIHIHITKVQTSMGRKCIRKLIWAVMMELLIPVVLLLQVHAHANDDSFGPSSPPIILVDDFSELDEASRPILGPTAALLKKGVEFCFMNKIVLGDKDFVRCVIKAFEICINNVEESEDPFTYGQVYDSVHECLKVKLNVGQRLVDCLLEIYEEHVKEAEERAKNPPRPRIKNPKQPLPIENTQPENENPKHGVTQELLGKLVKRFEDPEKQIRNPRHRLNKPPQPQGPIENSPKQSIKKTKNPPKHIENTPVENENPRLRVKQELLEKLIKHFENP